MNTRNYCFNLFLLGVKFLGFLFFSLCFCHRELFKWNRGSGGFIVADGRSKEFSIGDVQSVLMLSSLITKKRHDRKSQEAIIEVEHKDH